MEIPEEIKKKNILIVDDMPAIRYVTKSIITHAGFINVREAFDGKSAYKIIVKNKIDLVICDWHMPVMNGLELFERVMESEKHKAGFILLTSETESSKVKEALSAGIADYLIKPFKPKDLLKIVINRL